MATRTALVTGSSRGIGLEFVKQLAPSWNVIATCRDPASAAALLELQAANPSVKVLTLDVNDYEQLADLAIKLWGTPIDLLLLNAGIKGRTPDAIDEGALDAVNMAQVFQTNCISPSKMAWEFKRHVLASERKQIIVMSSGLASISDNTTGGSVAYRISKAAINMAMQEVAVKLASQGVHAMCLAPGWVKTDMGGANARLTVEESVSAMLEVVDKYKQLENGGFYFHTGHRLAW